MNVLKISSRITFLYAIGFFAHPTIAAEIEKSSIAGCAIELNGPIVEGDAKRFNVLAAQLGLHEPANSGEPTNTTDDALCLNSPGGSYLEGRLISQELRDVGIPTRVRENTECYSSCAFVFMAGRLRGAESDGTSRHLHIQGKLGFHAPYIRPDTNKTYDAGDLSEQVEITNLLVADFIRFGSDTSPFSGRPFFPVSLVARLLATPPTDLAYVATVEDAARWQIDLYGMREQVKLTENQLRQACINYLGWELDKETEISDFPYPITYNSGKLYNATTTWATVSTGGMEVQECQLEVATEPASGFVICTRDEGNGISRGNCKEGWGSWVPWYFGLPPRTALNQLQ